MSKRAGKEFFSQIEPGKKVRIGVVTRAMSKQRAQESAVTDEEITPKVVVSKKKERKAKPPIPIPQQRMKTRSQAQGEPLQELKVFRKRKLKIPPKNDDRIVEIADWVPEPEHQEVEMEEQKQQEYIDDGSFPQMKDRVFVKNWRQIFEGDEAQDLPSLQKQAINFTKLSNREKMDGYFVNEGIDNSWNQTIQNFRDGQQIDRIVNRLKFANSSIFQNPTQHAEEIAQQLAGVNSFNTGDPIDLLLMFEEEGKHINDPGIPNSYRINLSADFAKYDQYFIKQRFNILFPGIQFNDPNDFFELNILRYDFNDDNETPAVQIRNLTSKLACCLAMSKRFTELMTHSFNPTPIGGAELSQDQFENLMQQDQLFSFQISNNSMLINAGAQQLGNIPEMFPNDLLPNIFFQRWRENHVAAPWLNYFTHEHDRFFKQLFVLLFEGSILNIFKGYMMSAQKDVRFETHLTPEATEQLFVDVQDAERFQDEFSLTDENGNTLFESMESLAHRFSVSRLNVVLILKMVGEFLSTHLFAMGFSPKSAQTMNRLIMTFLPHSFKSLSNDKELEFADNASRPQLAWTCFNLIKLSTAVFRMAIYLNRSAHPVLDSQIKRGALIQHQGINAAVDVNIPPQYHMDDIEVLSRRFIFSSSINRLVFQMREFAPNTAGLQHFPRYNENFRPFEMDEDRNVNIFNKESFRLSDVQQNKFLVQKIWNLIFAQRDNFGPGNQLYLIHYVSVIVSFFINPQYGDQEMERNAVLNKQFRTFKFQLHDRGFLTEAQKQHQIQTSLQDQFEYFIGENLDHYAEDQDISALDPSSVSIESINITSLREQDISEVRQYVKLDREFVQIDNTYALNDRSYQYKFVSLLGGEGKFTKFSALFRGDIENDRDYISSRIEQFRDTPDFTCCFNVAFFIWNFFINEFIVQDNLESRFLFTKSEFYSQIRKHVMEGNVGQLFIECRAIIRQKATLVFYCPQSQIISYEGQLIEGQCVWIILKNSHCWIGDGFKLMEIYSGKKDMKHHVYKLPSRVFSKSRVQTKNKQTKVFYDIETLQNAQGEIMAPILLCYCSIFDEGEKEETGYFYGKDCVHQFIIYLDDFFNRVNPPDSNKRKKRQKIYVYAHNGAKFDHLFLQKWIMFYHLQSYQLIGSTHDIKFASFRSGIILRDTNLLFPGRLKDLAREFQTEHQKLDFDTPAITMTRIESEEGFLKKLIEYCQMDVQVLKEIYFKFIDSLQIAIPGFSEIDIKQTLPATALHTFDKFFINQTIYGNFPLRIGMKVQGLERVSYFGGVTQVFNHQKGENLCYYDFVSMYVSVMIQDCFPLSQGEYEAYSGEVQEGRLYSVSSFQFAQGCLLSNIPIKNQKTQVTIYPLQFHSGDAGVSFVMIWGREIKLAFKLGLVKIQIDGQIRYDQWGNVFKNYMTTFFNLKKNSSPSVAKISKLMGNSLYGKFGQRNEGGRFFINQGEADVLGAEGLSRMCQERMVQRGINMTVEGGKCSTVIDSVRKISNNVYEVIQCANERDLHTPGAFIRLASYITMCGRCRIIDLIRQIGVRDVFYCDTDSVVLNISAQHRISNIGKEVGCIADALKGSIIKEGYFAAAKCYGLILDKPYENKLEYVRFKGVKSPTVEMVKELKRSGKVQHAQDHWKRRVDGVGIEHIHKKILLSTKRKVNLDGTTVPFKNFQEYSEHESKFLTNEDGINFIYKAI